MNRRPKQLQECWKSSEFADYVRQVTDQRGTHEVIRDGRLYRIVDRRTGQAITLQDCRREMTKPQRDWVIDRLIALGVPTAIVIASIVCWLGYAIKFLGL